jgi:hypothetical protein
MNARPPAPGVRVPGTIPPWTETSVPLKPSDAVHAGPLDGATVTGEAARRQLSVRIGLWLDDSGRVRRARWRAVKEPALRACAEAACALLESGAEPTRVDASAIRRAAPEPARLEGEIADLVAAAVSAGVLASVAPSAR